MTFGDALPGATRFIVTVPATVVGLWLALKFARHWEDQAFWRRRAPANWWFSEEAWRAVVRVIPLVPPAMTTGFVVYLLDETGPHAPLLEAVRMVGSVVVFALVVVGGWVILHNRPRRLVPPPLRADPGLLRQSRPAKDP